MKIILCQQTWLFAHLLISYHFVGIILTAHFWGSISDLYGRRKILIITSLSAFAASVLSSLAVNLFQLACFRLLNGMFISGATSVIFAYLGEFLGEKNRSRSMMSASVIFGVFCISLPIMAWLVINQSWSFVIPVIQVQYRPWRLFLMACGFPSLFCGIVLLFFPESPKFTFSQVTSKIHQTFRTKLSKFFFSLRVMNWKLSTFSEKFTLSTRETSIIPSTESNRMKNSEKLWREKILLAWWLTRHFHFVATTQGQ